MKRDSLFSKIIYSFTTIISVILVLLAIFLSIFSESHLKNKELKDIDNELDGMTKLVYSYKLNQKTDELNNLNEYGKIIAKLSDSTIICVENNGYVYSVLSNSDDVNEYSSDNKYAELKLKMLPYAFSAEEKQDIQKGKTIISKDANETLSMDADSTITYIKPVLEEDLDCGYIIVIESSDELKQTVIDIKKMIWAIVIVALIISIITINFASKKVLFDPFEKISGIARKLANGDVDKRIEINSNDEIGELAQSFNIMAESLEQIDRNRREFISNVSHELRSPMTSIKGFLSGMIDGIVPKDKEGYYLKIIYDEVNRLTRLVNDLLDISALEQGKFNLNITEVDINAIIKLCLNNLEGKIEKKELNVEVLLEDKYKFVHADRDRIIQVVTNLIDNAVKYIQKGGKIEINVEEKRKKVYISVFNNGPQLTEEEIVHIWDRFYKADKSRTNKESTGLGLSIIRLILTQHDEDIWVKNVNGGVKFTFTLTSV